MFPVQSLTHIFLNYRRFRATANCHCKQAYLIAIVIYRQENIYWNDNALVGVSVDAHLSVGDIQSDNLIISSVNLDKITTRVAALREKVLINFLSNHTDLPSGQDVSLADKTAIFN